MNTDQKINGRPGMRRALAGVIAPALLICGVLGCAQPAFNDPARQGPFFAPSNHVGEATLGGIRRVVLLPLWSGAAAPVESAAALDPVVVSALQEVNRFEIVTLSREECLRRFHAEALSSAAALPHDLMAGLKREFAADAVLFVDLTTFRAYRPLVLGLRAKLATLDGTRLIWTFDNVFSADDPTVANAARHFFLGADRSGVPADLTRAALQSPSRFAAYATATMFATLPPVTLPAPPEAVKPDARGR
jgi:hypothetical protein